MNSTHLIDSRPLTLAVIKKIIEERQQLCLSDEATAAIERSHDYLRQVLDTSDDPVYGIAGGREDIVQFGDLELRGERGLLLVPESQLTRLRYNPFFDYLKDRVAVFLDLQPTLPSQAGQ